MHSSLREPLFVRDPDEPEDEVVAALAAEVIWLCRSGELDQLYRVYPGFSRRTTALERLVHDQRLKPLAQKFPGRRVLFWAACHDGACSMTLQVLDAKGRATPCADALIPIRLRDGVSPDGRPLIVDDGTE